MWIKEKKEFMKKYLIAGILAAACVAFSYNSCVWAQAEEKKALTPEEAAEAMKKLEDAQQKLKRVVKNTKG